MPSSSAGLLVEAQYSLEIPVFTINSRGGITVLLNVSLEPAKSREIGNCDVILEDAMQSLTINVVTKLD